MAQDHSCDHHGVPFRSLSDHLAAVLAVGKPTTTRTVATEEAAGAGAGARSPGGPPALCPSSRGLDLSPGWTLSNVLPVGNDMRL